jgi:hypothetical protein
MSSCCPLQDNGKDAGMSISQACEQENAGYENFKFLLTDIQVAKLLNVSVATTRRWRLLRIGPRWIKLGGSIRYRIEDCLAFIEQNAVEVG